MNDKPQEKFELTGDFVKDGFRLAKNIQLMGKEVRHLAMAFTTVGNDKISDQLFNIFLECEIYDKALRDLIGSETSRGLNDAQKMSGQILNSLLTGVKIGKENNLTPE